MLDAAKHTLHFDQPVRLMLLGVVNHIMDDAEAYTSVARLVSELAPGSMMALNHSTAEIHGNRCCG
ncbi:SAM-dependent methyltransferase [Pseudonocardia cypriaca]|uniref:SAM-dependent methyltransferase n=1 Tax=Pseudonocardia cypriaca TaxID=882449 RepID=UPI0024831910|nr:SAM-dependent methyltransferase [Pseudonocardia cypriaca]